jgi:hypothetical protein
MLHHCELFNKLSLSYLLLDPGSLPSLVLFQLLLPPAPPQPLFFLFQLLLFPESIPFVLLSQKLLLIVLKIKTIVKKLNVRGYP